MKEPKFALFDTGQSPVQKWTQHELNNLVDAIARLLSAKNMAPRARVAILASNSAEYLAAYLAILKVGLVVVPVNTKAPIHQVSSILHEVQCSLLFCDEKFKTGFSSSFETIAFGSELNQLLKRGLEIQDEALLKNSGIILHTSGSSGKSKPAFIPYQNLDWKIQNAALELASTIQKADFVHLLSAPFYHMNGIYTAQVLLRAEGTFVIAPQFLPKNFAQLIQDYRVTSISGVPSMMALLFEAVAIEEYDFSTVKYINLASAPFSENLYQKIKDYFPNAVGRIQNNYGLTEVGPNLFGRHPEGKPRPELSVGYPRKGIDYRIVDGILQVRSPSAMTKYADSSVATENKITADGYYITQDLFSVDQDGFYFFEGRADDLIVCGGEKIYPLHIVKALEKHLFVESAFVIALPDEIKGSKPYAFIVPRKGVQVQEEELKRHVLSHLPTFATPRRIWQLTSAPHHKSGKIDLHFLRILAQELLSGKASPLVKESLGH